MHLLFVCTGNTCRSPLAEVVARRELAARGAAHVTVGSAGTHAGLIVGLTESFGGLYLGESLGQIGISLIFILILLFRPMGLFGGKR